MTLVFQVTAAQHLSITEFGEFAYAATLLNIGGLIAPLGFHVTVVKYMARYRIADEVANAAALLRVARQWTLAGGLAVAALITIKALTGESASSMSTALLLACAVPFAALTRIETARLRGKGHSTLSVFLEVPMREGTAALLLLLVILMGHADAPRTAACYAAAIVLGLAAAMSRHRSDPASPAPPAQQREWWSVALSALVSTAALQLLRRMDIVVVGSVSGYADAGVYAAATRLADVIQLPLVAATVMAAPQIAELYSKNRITELQRLVGKVGWFAFTLSCIGALPLLLLPGQVLKLFGAEFAGGDSALRWLVLGQLFNALTSCAALLLTMTGHEWRAAIITSCVGLASIGANWLLAVRYGMTGVAAGTCCSLIVWNLVLCVVGYRKTKVVALPMLRTRLLQAG